MKRPTYEHDPNPEFCAEPDNPKPHVHKADGDPACSAHGMMHQPRTNWLCMDPDCTVKYEPKAHR